VFGGYFQSVFLLFLEKVIKITIVKVTRDVFNGFKELKWVLKNSALSAT
jgi:hypothetical protein